MLPSVLVVGSLHYDLMIAGPRLPLLGETLPGSSWHYKAGGKGGNQAVDAARHGVAVSMIGCVGKDDFGKVLVRNLARAGVDTAHVAIIKGETGLSIAITEAEGDYAAVIISAANAMMQRNQIEEATALFDSAGIIVLQNEIPEEINILAAQMGRKAGAKVILNAGPSRPMCDTLKPLIDILVVNSLEAEGLGSCSVTDLASAQEAARQLAHDFPAVIVTAGGNGVAFCAGDDEAALAPHKIRLVSTHGAGDAFIGALSAELAKGETLRFAVTRANAAAAVIVSMPDTERQALDAKQMRYNIYKICGF
ncbi:ribokinase [Asaia platycodi]|uniref:ribokinase n=1 Tax=Asaia platycodi TaxID=610243 RepID=UPI000470396F|nr:ribokinase [Asaia platycodi]